MFSISWDRIANVPVGTYNVKLPAVAFSVAALAVIPLLHGQAAAARPRLVLVAASVAGLLAAWLAVTAFLADDRPAAVAQLAAIASGAFAPAVAVFGVVSTRARLLWACRWLVAGGYVASLFGLYQLIAFYTHLPQFVTYTGTGINGGVGRIAAFNYEPAYFAYFLLIVIGARLVLARASSVRIPWLEIAFFAVVLELANVRALMFALPTLALLLLFDWRRQHRTVLRAGAVAVVVVALFALSPLIGNSARATPEPAKAPEPSAAPVTAQPAPEHKSAPEYSTLSPDEKSSNAPRLSLYRQVIDVALAHPLLGVGPGNLGATLQPSRPRADQQGVIANNVWLQAVADGGLPAALLEATMVALLFAPLIKRRYAEVQPLAAGALAVLLVGGMLTSYFFDSKVWAAMALVYAGARLAPIPPVRSELDAPGAVQA